MNKLRRAIIISLILLSTGVIAGGFVGDQRSQVNLQKWKCEYCPKLEQWEINLETHVGLLDDDIYRFSNYSGVDNDLQVYFSGDVNLQTEDNRYWKTSFQNVGLDAVGIQSEYGVRGKYSVDFEFQSIPIRNYDQLITPYTSPGTSILVLPDDWNRSANGADFAPSSAFTTFSLGTDWDILKFGFEYQADNNLDYKTSYRRLEKQGIRESSFTQLFSASYLPIPVDQVTEDYSAMVNYFDENWYASFEFQLSRFENNITSITAVTPYLPVVSGSGVANIATEPANTSTRLSFNSRYNYAEKSYARFRYSLGKLIQDEIFQPYTTNPNLALGLPQIDLDGEVKTEDLTLQLNHWFNNKWSFKGKYRYRERDNKSDQLAFFPIISDAFVAAGIVNLPYDFTKESFLAQLNFRLTKNQKLSLAYKNNNRTRNFQSIAKTSEDGFDLKYRANYRDDLTVFINLEHLARDNSAPQLIDFLGVEENPLMRRFNLAKRDQDKVNLQLFYSIRDNLDLAFSTQFNQQDYSETEIGLTNNKQTNYNLDLNWQYSPHIVSTVFVQKEKIKTQLSGSNTFSISDWSVDNLDEVYSYGVNLSFRKLLDNDLDLNLSFNRSDADTTISITQANPVSPLPEVTSSWSTVEMDLNYDYSKNISYKLSYQYQDFESDDFAIDKVVPGTVGNLLTFGALSNNYDVNYIVLTVAYKF